MSGEQGNKSLKLKGTGEQRLFWGIQILILGNKGKCLFFAGVQGNSYPPLGGPHKY